MGEKQLSCIVTRVEPGTGSSCVGRDGARRFSRAPMSTPPLSLLSNPNSLAARTRRTIRRNRTTRIPATGCAQPLGPRCGCSPHIDQRNNRQLARDHAHHQPEAEPLRMGVGGRTDPRNPIGGDTHEFKGPALTSNFLVSSAFASKFCCIMFSSSEIRNRSPLCLASGWYCPRMNW